MLTDRQTDRQTNNNDYTTSLAEVKTLLYSAICHKLSQRMAGACPLPKVAT